MWLQILFSVLFWLYTKWKVSQTKNQTWTHVYDFHWCNNINNIICKYWNARYIFAIKMQINDSWWWIKLNINTSYCWQGIRVMKLISVAVNIYQPHNFWYRIKKIHWVWGKVVEESLVIHKHLFFNSLSLQKMWVWLPLSPS